MGLVGLCSPVIARKQLVYFGRIFNFRVKVPPCRWDSYKNCYGEMWVNSKAMHYLDVSEA